MVRFTIGLLAATLLAASATAGDAEKDVIKTAMMAVTTKTDVAAADAVLKKFTAGESKMKGKMTIDGTDLPFTGSMTYSVPSKVHMKLEVMVGGQQVTLVQVVNGNGAKQTENGKPVEIKPAAKVELLQAALLQDAALLYPLLVETDYTLSAGTKSATHTVVKVEGKAKNLATVELYFNKDGKEKGMLAKMTRTGLDPSGKEVAEETSYSEYDKLGTELLVPKVSRVKHKDKLFLDIEVTEFKAVPKVEETLFKVD